MTSIDDFRTKDFRVFHAAPYFSLDLWYEIKWHKNHLKKLRQQKKKPYEFHRKRNHLPKAHVKMHYKEHVIDSIPFHEKFLKDHEKRLEHILKLVSKKTYIKLVKITRKHHGLPEYFVYDKKNNNFFFIAEHLTHEKKNWIKLVKDRHKICDVLVLN